ncbi:uracil-DNA glycosylase [Sphingomonas donggukensis]|uniref:Uracil-DNA glycosylase n=1 Tax=Sphingomonas donggukensis TaxID=2949093 RepID=A0ABY4TVP3_9SPHN|nr:uracil-DNA glycosylase [Sphingomonas donggukensis]URW76463.1 uracil-DNA glycosylase [Sphingomonas donggukensis]
MGADQHTDWTALAASTLEWWRDAGVDTLVEDAPRDWLARAVPMAATPIADAVAEVAAPALPDTLDAFVAWRLGDAAPEAGRGAVIGPEGDVSSGVMVIVDFPEGETLLDGAAGRLFDRMLAAIGRDRASIYLASLTTARPLTARIAPEAEALLAPLIYHHVALATPRILLTLGAAASRAMIGTDAHEGQGNLRAVNLNGASVPVVASYHPRALIERPAMKAAAWKDLQLLMGGLR